jgi:hypothetical protein
VRHLLPAHYSTAGAEAAAHRLRNLYEQRSLSLRHARRTVLLLGLTRLHLNNRDDDVNADHRILRRATEAAAAGPPTAAQPGPPRPGRGPEAVAALKWSGGVERAGVHVRHQLGDAP